jgi:hypothetical protein
LRSTLVDCGATPLSSTEVWPTKSDGSVTFSSGAGPVVTSGWVSLSTRRFSGEP